MLQIFITHVFFRDKEIHIRISGISRYDMFDAVGSHQLRPNAFYFLAYLFIIILTRTNIDCYIVEYPRFALLILFLAKVIHLPDFGIVYFHRRVGNGSIRLHGIYDIRTLKDSFIRIFGIKRIGYNRFGQ